MRDSCLQKKKQKQTNDKGTSRFFVCRKEETIESVSSIVEFELIFHLKMSICN